MTAPAAASVLPAESIWARGARTVAQAQADSGLSRQELWSLMDAGTVRWFAHGGRGTRILSWGDITDYLDGLHKEHLSNSEPAADRRELPRRMPGQNRSAPAS